MTWLILALIALLWIVVAGWRTVVFVGDDMLESWRTGEEYTNEFFGEAMRAGLLHGILWPITAPFTAMGNLLYGWAHRYADRRYEAPAKPVPEKPRHDITDELAKVKDEPIPEPRGQVRIREQAQAAREEYAAQRLQDETAVGTIPAYEGRRRGPDDEPE
jgi:hypothetical protein